MAKTVLVVDDNVHMRGLITHMVKRNFSVNVIQAKDGKEALGIIFVRKPNLVLLDIEMPVMNGLQVLKAVRDHPVDEVKNIPIIMLTGSREKSDVETALEFKVNGYIVKPINEISAVEQIKKVIPQKKEKTQKKDENKKGDYFEL